MGGKLRARITQLDVMGVRQAWLAAGLSPKTITRRVQTLRHLYRTLDGREAATPADGVAPLPVLPRPHPVVPRAVLQRVAVQLTDPKTKARDMVLVSTGVRPSELWTAAHARLGKTRRAYLRGTGGQLWGRPTSGVESNATTGSSSA